MSHPRILPFLLTIALPLVVLFVSAAATAQEDELIISNPDAYAVVQRGTVTFSHALHMDGFDCLACHHDYADDENILDTDELEEGNPAIRCTACHDGGATIGLRRAYHRKCLGCHRKTRLQGMSSGPELCGECHVK